jgi:predicted metal-dependent hydrolase
MSLLPTQKDLWLPEYSVRVSHRAKRLQLKVKPLGEVEVVIPKGVAKRHIPGFVAEHQQWLRDTLEHYAKQKPIDTSLPTTINLSAINECWQVNYDIRRRTRTTERLEHDTLKLVVPGNCEAQQKAALQLWLRRKAKNSLIPWLEDVSNKIDLPFAKTTVRAQKTRWGSCSSKKHININRALLFMSPEAVRYLFIHELCHTVHLNHSRRYWSLVEKHCADFRIHEKALRKAMGIVPHWAIPA